MNLSGTWLITGITGFIGSLLAKHLMSLPEYKQGALCILGLVRDEEKAKKVFADDDCEKLQFVKADLCDTQAIFEITGPVDFIVHCAAATASSYMISNPVETADGIVLGTRNMLELAKQKNVKSMVYVSSMEVYGQVKDIGRPRTEEELGEVVLTSWENRTRTSDTENVALEQCYAVADYFEAASLYKVAVENGNVVEKTKYKSIMDEKKKYMNDILYVSETIHEKLGIE